MGDETGQNAITNRTSQAIPEHVAFKIIGRDDAPDATRVTAITAIILIRSHGEAIPRPSPYRGLGRSSHSLACLSQNSQSEDEEWISSELRRRICRNSTWMSRGWLKVVRVPIGDGVFEAARPASTCKTVLVVDPCYCRDNASLTSFSTAKGFCNRATAQLRPSSVRASNSVPRRVPPRIPRLPSR